ncbi:MAG TPA: tetratricopeptide repeat protein [Steroidobacteraceae bacterium]|jgi:tetratricopeptide (TPR) repeat protein|nr:tetratricopeptide repeat protein [Steroidobacteraceae bacterium]
MRSFLGHIVFTVLVAAPLGVVLAHGGGSMPSGPSGMVTATPRSAVDAAKSAYNAGVRNIKRAQEYDADAVKAATPEKAAKAHDKAQKAYHDSLSSFIDAVGADPKMYEAWNYLGFANRHLGNYEDALSSYAKALEINPNFPNAIEYRGEAYLGLNQLEEAKGAYMALFRDSRPLADELMVAMHHWADARRQDAQGLSSGTVEAFTKWMDERAGIAAQTASLAIGAAQPWRQGLR